jgi:hypothetical protein
MLLRRLRGLLGATLLGAGVWTPIGVLVGLVFQLGLIPGIQIGTTIPIPGGLPVAMGLVGAIIGAINGLTFGGLLLATERGKKVDDIKGWRFAVLSALATAATLGVMFQSGVAAGIGGALGAVGGMGALWLARRARGEAEPEATDAVAN